ncbi:hypothetical protein BDQ12DRAFT_691997 [Crucibulum laeve]|uniref:ATP-dependent DNA ligase family profile domain-containing protein n=1 Tax=Crucibulum laeve TaxID=68775 RepID=A0A5C3LJC1_9AGAR|nr:hypothetical protein BDQ12DRAFT_691997 [Crucibulum laeve]
MSQTSSELGGGVPFSYFCSLLREISNIKPRKAEDPSLGRDSANNTDYPAYHVLERWIANLRRRFGSMPAGTTAIVFRLLFPDQDVRRKYDLQETRLGRTLADCLGVERDKLTKWKQEDASGSLGTEVRKVLKKLCPYAEGYIAPLTIVQVDELLNELASNSSYSHKSIHAKYPPGIRRKRIIIFQDLFRQLPPDDSCFLTQIILKDLRPVLYPLSEAHYTSALRNFKSNSVRMLTLEHAMKAWDTTGWLLKCYRVRSEMDVATNSYDLPADKKYELTKPITGTVVQIPKSEKGRGCRTALEFLEGSKIVWAETKYDGERAQIHVHILDDNTSKITIFSKSKRDSTQDRIAVHDIIRDALGLADSHSKMTRDEPVVVKNVILDAEMVAWSNDHIDEFWRIRALVESTAKGIRRCRQKPSAAQNSHDESDDDVCSQASMRSDTSDSRNLALVFFDVLMLDSISMLTRPYSQRRMVLENLIQLIPGKAMLAERFPIDMQGGEKRSQLRQTFAERISRHEEGLVLKAEEGRYHDYRFPWVKVKRDYIEGYGDTVDLVIVGASWEKERARELRVPPTVYTTFYVGAFKKRPKYTMVKARQHIMVYFTASYGMSRDQLEELNFLIKNSDTLPYRPSMKTNALPYTFTIFSGLKSPPTIILRIPLLAELFGAGFTKAPGSMHYELRFPRISKIYRVKERPWTEGVHLASLHDIACESIGRERSDKDLELWCNGVFGKVIKPAVDPVLKRKQETEEWEDRLTEWDGKSARVGEPISPPRKRPRLESPTEPLSQPSLASQPLGLATNTYASSSIIQAASIAPESILNLQISQPRTPLKSTYLPSPITSPVKPATDEDLIFELQSYPSLKEDLGSYIPSLALHSSTLIRVSPPLPSLPSSVQPLLDNESLIWFSDKRRVKSCLSCSSWRNSISRSQYLHTLDAVLSGCGWSSEDGSSTWMKRGIIFIHDHEQTGKKSAEEILETLSLCKDLNINGRPRKPIWIFGCGTKEL